MKILRLVDEPFGCEPFDLELTAERLRAERLTSSRSGPKGLQVERLAHELIREVYRLTKKRGFARGYALMCHKIKFHPL